MFEKKNFCLIVTGILCLENGKRIFVSEFCVCLRILVPEFLSKRILCLEKNFCLTTGILCLEKEFLSQNFVCVCVSEFLSQNFWFFGNRIFFVTGILKRKVFLHVKSECF